MKKFLAIILMLVLCLSVFAGCKGEDPAAADLEAAGTYLFNLYKDDAEITPSDFDVAGKVKVDSTTFDVEWTVDVTEGVTIKASEKEGFFTVDVDEKTATEISYTLTATIKDAEGNTIHIIKLYLLKKCPLTARPLQQDGDNNRKAYTHWIVKIGDNLKRRHRRKPRGH